MMDFGGKDVAGNENQTGSEDSQDLTSQESGGQPARPERTVVQVSADNVVELPAGTALDTIEVEGRDLVIVLSDGTEIVIPDGAIVVPQIQIGEVTVPPANLAALMIGNEPEPAAGSPQSSGGNFAGAVGDIQAAYGLGNLLPYTELQFPQPEEREIIPYALGEPEIVIETPDNPGGVVNAIATVDEAGLPARDGESEGTNEPSDSEIAYGTIIFSAPDGVGSVLINGVAITEVGQIFVGEYGTLTVTSIDFEGGTIGFFFTLQDNLVGETVDGSFVMTVIDIDGDRADANLQIIVRDDAPIARDDSAAQPSEDAWVNVDVFQNDTPGADSVAYSNIAAVEDSLSGSGELVYNGNGTFTYKPAPGEEGTVTFQYTITDGDGSPSTATVTITLLPDSTPKVQVLSSSNTVVDEAGLPFGSDPGSGRATAEGLISFDTGNDALASLIIGGVDVTQGGTVNGAYGTLTVTANPNGGYAYSYTLTSQSDDLPGNETDDFSVLLTDSDGDPASTRLSISIVDDVPVAANDANSVTEGLGNSTSGNVYGAGGVTAPSGGDAADNIGADGAKAGGAVTGAYFGTEAANLPLTAVSGATVIAGTYGNLTINPDGSYSYTLKTASIPAGVTSETFTYEVTDGDNDTDRAQLVIQLNQDARIPDTTGSTATVFEDGLADGVQHGANSETGSGTFTVDGNNESYSFTLTADNGNTLTNPVMNDTLTTSKGVLTITSVSAPDAGGVVTYGYSYTLSGALTHTGQGEINPLTDTITMAVTDATGDSDTTPASIVISIVDDVPVAANDANSVTEGLGNSTSGNVYGAGGVTAPSGGDAADNIGADGAKAGGAVTGAYFGTEAANLPLTAVSGATVIAGTYGNLTINPDGSYSYTLKTASIPAGVTSETFTYEVTDGDNDTDRAQLVIQLNQDARIPDTTGSTATVFEDGLADGVQHGANSETGSGTFTVDGNNESYSFTLTADNGNTLTNPVMNDTLTTSKGVLTITSVSAPDAGGVVTYGYSYTLSGALTHTGQGEINPLTDTITMAVTDATGDSDTTPASIVISIVDDVPVAANDANSVTEGLGNSTSGNVYGAGGVTAPSGGDAADNIGADGAKAGGAVTGAYFGTEAANLPLTAVSGATVIAGTYGNLTINPDGSYSYTLKTASIPAGVTSETFTYEVTDGDNDTDRAQLVIQLNQDARIPDTTGSTATVFEDGLADGVQHGANSETGSGTFTVDGNNESYSFTLTADNGNTLTNPVMNDTLTTSKGVLTITSVSAPDAGGVVTYGYSYTLSGALTHTGQGEINPLTDTITMAVTDATGDSDTTPASIVISIVDDVPVAANDANSVTEGLGNSTSGNVYGAGGVTAPSGGDAADNIGADGAKAGGAVTGAYFGTEAANLPLTAVSGATVIAGTYGNLTINPDGSYSYTLKTASIPAGVTSETFTYEVTDGDNDTDRAQLVIQLNQDARIPDTTGSTATVFEDGLADGVQHGANSETGSGTFTVDGNNESYSFTLTADNGNTLTNPVMNDTLTTSKGVLTITSVSAPDAGGVVTYGYSYTLSGALTHTGQGEINPLTDTITMAVTDATGDSDTTPASIVISIVDDVPVAANDANSVTEGLGNSTSGNVYGAGGVTAPSGGDAADNIGADGAKAGGAVTGAYFGTEAANLPLTAVSGATVIAGTYGNLTINPDGSYSYTLKTASIPAGVTSETFTYEVTDGDNDTDRAQLVIQLNQDARIPDTTGSTATVFEDGLADGVQHGANSETGSGTFTVDGNNESYSFTLTADNGNTLTNPVMNDTLTTSKGVLTITSVSAPDAGGVVTYGYSYTLSGALTHTGQGEINPLTDTITMAVTDATGDSDTTPASIVISIVDDVPVAANDANSVTEGLGNSTSGNVYGAGGVTAPSGGDAADNIGADGAKAGGAVTGAYFGTEAANLPLTAVSGATVIAGTYGNLTINPDGSYSYTLKTASIPAGVTSETFTYEVTDGDNDTDRAQLVIQLNQDARIPDTTGSTATVFEDGLADGVQHGANSETGSGTFTVDGNNESYSFTLTADNGNTLTNPVMNDTLTTSKGVLTITSVSAPDAGGVVTYGYSYTLSGALTHTGQGEINPLTDTITMAVTDATGDSDTTPASIVISIVDDVPVAANDANSVTEGLGNSTSGNVYGAGGVTAPSGGDAADNIGADGAKAGGAVTGAYFGTEAANLPLTAVSGATVIAGTYGNLTINPDGSYSYTLKTASIPAGVTSETFTYEVTDGDNDTDRAQLVIQLNQDARIPDTTGSTATVFEDGLADGVQHGANSETGSGTFTVDGNNESYSFTLTADNGNTLTNPVMNDTLTTSKGVLTITSVSAPDAGGVVTYGYSYTLSGALTHTGQGEINPLTDTITMAVTDATGDSDTTPASIVISIVDDVPVAANDANSVTEGLGNSTSGNVYGAGGVTAPSGGDAADNIGADGAKAGGAVTGAYFGTEAANLPLTAVSGATVIAGTYGNLTINPDGSYSYTLKTASIPAGVTSETFTYEVTDGDNDTDRAQLVIQLNQDARIPDTTGSTATVFEDGLADGVQHGANSETGSGTFTVDGNNESYSFTLTADNGNTLTNPVMNDTLTTSKGVLTITSVSAPDAGGVVTYGYSYTLSGALTHTGQGEINPLTDTITMAVTDATGDSDTTPASIVISIVDDVPVAVVTQIAVVSQFGGAGSASGTFNLDTAPLANNLLDNFGADGGTVKFSSTQHYPDLTSNGQPIQYEVLNGGSTLRGYTSAGTVFTVTIDDGTSPPTYSVSMQAVVDVNAQIDFNNGGYNFVGGFNDWTGFVPVGETLGGTTINNDSQDLLLTPAINGAYGSKINSTATIGGVGGGASVGATETFRVDFVTDLRGDPASTGGGDYGTASHRDHVYDGHYTVNGASALFKSSSGSTVRITASTDDDSDITNTGTYNVGDGTVQQITSVVISYLGVQGDAVTPTSTLQTVTVNGHDFTYKLATDGKSVDVGGVAGSGGSSLNGTIIAVYTINGYNSVAYTYVSGDTFQIGDFGASVSVPQPINFALPIAIVDGDGDGASSYIDINLRASTLANGVQTSVTQDASDSATPVTLASTTAQPHLIGSAFNDTLTGNSTGNVIIGGKGADTMTGNGGNDLFVIDPSHIIADSPDTITDYTAGDTIDLRGLFSSMGSFAPSNPTEAAATIRLFGNALQVDSNGTGTGAIWVTVAILSNNPPNVSVLYDFDQNSASLAMITPSLDVSPLSMTTMLDSTMAHAANDSFKQSDTFADLAFSSRMGDRAAGIASMAAAASAFAMPTSFSSGHARAFSDGGSSHEVAQIAVDKLVAHAPTQAEGFAGIQSFTDAEPDLQLANAPAPSSRLFDGMEQAHDGPSVMATADEDGFARVYDLGGEHSAAPVFDFASHPVAAMDAASGAGMEALLLMAAAGKAPVEGGAVADAADALTTITQEAAVDQVIDFFAQADGDHGASPAVSITHDAGMTALLDAKIDVGDVAAHAAVPVDDMAMALDAIASA